MKTLVLFFLASLLSGCSLGLFASPQEATPTPKQTPLAWMSPAPVTTFSLTGTCAVASASSTSSFVPLKDKPGIEIFSGSGSGLKPHPAFDRVGLRDISVDQTSGDIMVEAYNVDDSSYLTAEQRAVRCPVGACGALTFQYNPLEDTFVFDERLSWSDPVSSTGSYEQHEYQLWQFTNWDLVPDGEHGISRPAGVLRNVLELQYLLELRALPGIPSDAGTVPLPEGVKPFDYGSADGFDGWRGFNELQQLVSFSQTHLFIIENVADGVPSYTARVLAFSFARRTWTSAVIPVAFKFKISSAVFSKKDGKLYLRSGDEIIRTSGCQVSS